jgi:hypothetical protein
VTWNDVTFFGRAVVAVDSRVERERLLALLAPLFALEDLDAVTARFRAAATPAARLDALLAVSALRVVQGEWDPRVKVVLAEALEDAEPVVRLAAMRTTGFCPKGIGLELLQGREDSANPGLAGWVEIHRNRPASK